MPATSGRVRMPADNRLSVSDSLKTSEIWQKSVGYDPYAPGGEASGTSDSAGVPHGEYEEKAKGIFALARLTGNSSSTTPGACRRCNQVGHLAFQCRNHLSLKIGSSSGGLLRQTVPATMVPTSSSESENDESRSGSASDSGEDNPLERLPGRSSRRLHESSCVLRRSKASRPRHSSTSSRDAPFKHSSRKLSRRDLTSRDKYSRRRRAESRNEPSDESCDSSSSERVSKRRRNRRESSRQARSSRDPRRKPARSRSSSSGSSEGPTRHRKYSRKSRDSSSSSSSTGSASNSDGTRDIKASHTRGSHPMHLR